MKTTIFDTLPSTNEELKKLKTLTEDQLYIARMQTGGKGSKGRSFICEKGGVYASLLRLNPCKASDSFKIMIGAAVAVVKTLAAFDVNAEIKWPNDIFYNGKKICGILIENVIGGDEVTRSIIGIGVNVNNDLAPEIKDIAVSVKQITGNSANIEAFYATLAYNLYKEYSMEEYISYCKFLGKEITVIKGDKSYRAVAESVLPDGNLKLKSGEILSAAEITIR